VTTRADKRYPFRINSGLFREMLNGSAAPTSIDSPLSVDEHSEDFEIMLLILNGRGDEVMDRAKTWEYSAKLYGLVDKYRIEGHRYWFSQICRSQAAKAPWEAIFLACKQSPVDTTIIGPAIAEGFATRLFSEVCDPSYFTNLHAEHGAYSSFKNPNSYPDAIYRYFWEDALVTLGSWHIPSRSRVWRLVQWTSIRTGIRYLNDSSATGWPSRRKLAPCEYLSSLLCAEPSTDRALALLEASDLTTDDGYSGPTGKNEPRFACIRYLSKFMRCL
jgi:hypothetical protein